MLTEHTGETIEQKITRLRYQKNVMLRQVSETYDTKIAELELALVREVLAHARH